MDPQNCEQNHLRLAHIEQYKKDEQALQICLETIRNHNDFEPLYVLGIVEAKYSLPGSIVSLATSFYAILLSAYQSAANSKWLAVL